MIRLCKTHLKFLFHNYVVLVSYGVILLWFVICLSISGITSGIHEITFRQEYYREAYLFDGITFLKLIILITVLFDTIYVVVLNKYDVILSNLYSNKVVVITKLFTLLLYNLLIAMILITVYINIWILLPYDLTFQNVISLIVSMSLYTFQSTMVFVAFYYYFKHMLTIIIPYIVAVISVFSVDYGTSLHDFSFVSWIIQLVYPDVVYMEERIGYTTGIVYVLTFLVVICILLIRKYLESDHLYC